ncbi:small nuclear ribonucleoprotein E-like [Prunus dulcis]|uniref:small nuclear ribonucleoprotein E-like n=1 Tax=Prunus dulcis TaxID=3755 RepID=UPI001481F0C1|nr:small nuclear ribonucleoprotein E-like [Prunus dulcis]
MASTKVQRIMTQPINLIFRFLQSKARIQIWLFEQKDLRIEGRIIVSLFCFVFSNEIFIRLH